jgi:pimeloyl-ACP methyl ester carboxylesterase
MKPIFAVAVGLLFVHGAAYAAPSCRSAGAERVDVGDHKIWMQTSGAGSPTVVFEAGGGDDSSVWADIAPKMVQNDRVRTVVYDRAGLGKSEPKPGPYSIDDEAASLQRALTMCEVRGPVVLVAQSDGGFIAALLATNDKRVAGIVLVDATAKRGQQISFPAALPVNIVAEKGSDVVLDAVKHMVERVRADR